MGGLSKEGENLSRGQQLWFGLIVLQYSFLCVVFFSLTLIKPPYLKNCQGKCCGGCEVSQLLPYYQYIGLKFEQGFIVVFS